jgi:hypothetical protein
MVDFPKLHILSWMSGGGIDSIDLPFRYMVDLAD